MHPNPSVHRTCGCVTPQCGATVSDFPETFKNHCHHYTSFAWGIHGLLTTQNDVAMESQVDSGETVKNIKRTTTTTTCNNSDETEKNTKTTVSKQQQQHVITLVKQKKTPKQQRHVITLVKQ